MKPNPILQSVIFALLAHSGYVVYRAFQIKDETFGVVGFWDALRGAAANEFPMLPIYIAVAIIVGWLWGGMR